MRRFQVNRKVDESGVSGTGIVAQGVEFDNGVCAITWLSNFRSVEVTYSIKEFKAIHGHGGLTTIEWLDPDEEEQDEQPNISGDGDDNRTAGVSDASPTKPKRKRSKRAAKPKGGDATE